MDVKVISRIMERFGEEEQIEYTFKFVIWLSITALVSKGVAALLHKGDLVTGILVLFIAVCLIAQVFWFGVQRIMIPFIEALLPNTNFIEASEKLAQLSREHRLKVMKKLLFTWQTGVFAIVYLGFFYFMQKLFTALVMQGNG